MKNPAEVVFSGIDHTSVLVYGLGCILVGAAVYFIAPPVFAPYVVGVALAAAAFAAGTRYRLRVAAEGMEWTLFAGWVFPVTRLRYLLDADIRYYESLEATEPEGLYVSRSWLADDETDSPCFGPSRQGAITALHESIGTAIRRARDTAPPTPARVRCPLLAPHVSKLDLANAGRNAQGRIRTVTALEAFRIGDIGIPAGSSLELNGDDYLDPRRQDSLRTALVQARIRLPLGGPAGVEVGPGTRVGITASGRVHFVSALLSPLELDGFPVDGNASILFDEQGRMRMFTLGRDFRMGGYDLAAGTQFSSFSGEQWHCRLSRALQLPELEVRAGDAVVFSKADHRPVWVHARDAVDRRGRKLHGPVRIRPGGRIDRRYAR